MNHDRLKADWHRMTVTLTLEDADGLEQEFELPARAEVCGRCEGKGKHDNPAFDNGITMEEWHGPDWDDESREAYMAGRYDVTCAECGGQRVTLEPIEDKQNPNYRRYAEWRSEEAAFQRQCAAERRMGA